MAFTVLQLIQKACYRSNLPAPSALVGSTDPATLQLLELFYEVGEDLRASRNWDQLKRQAIFTLTPFIDSLTLPGDFYCFVPQTMWDRRNNWQLAGPQTDQAWTYQVNTWATTEGRRTYRVFGQNVNTNTDYGQLKIHPTPGEADAGQLVTVDYISRLWLLPPNWAASASVTLNHYRNSEGNIYQATTGGTTGSLPPNFIYGIGRDAGVRWKYIAANAWTDATYYSAGNYATNGGSLYVATTGGTPQSGGTGPSGTGAAITDGTVVWAYKATPTWSALTEYVPGDHVINTNSRYYVCVTPDGKASKSSKNQPNWTATQLTDGSVTWTVVTTPYEQIASDSDICLFDEELMIVGLRARFMEARGLEAGAIRERFERMKDAAATRWNAGRRINLAGESTVRAFANIPDGGWDL